MNKPNGLTTVHQCEVAALMENLPVQELCGIGPKTQEKLNKLGIKTCGELGRYPEKQLTGIFGINGSHLKRMGQGLDENPVLPYIHEPATKSMGHSFTLNKDTRDLAEIRRHLLQLSEQVGRRLRRDSFAGRTISLVLRYADFSTSIKQHSLKSYIDDGLRIHHVGMKLFEELYLPPRLVRLLGISVSGLVRDLKQTAAFVNNRTGSLFETLDTVNDKYGEFSVARARLQERTPGPRVISPSWRPGAPTPVAR
jgi:DNA polymerase-4